MEKRRPSSLITTRLVDKNPLSSVETNYALREKRDPCRAQENLSFLKGKVQKLKKDHLLFSNKSSLGLAFLRLNTLFLVLLSGIYPGYAGITINDSTSGWREFKDEHGGSISAWTTIYDTAHSLASLRIKTSWNLAEPDDIKVINAQFTDGTPYNAAYSTPFEDTGGTISGTVTSIQFYYYNGNGTWCVCVLGVCAGYCDAFPMGVKIFTTSGTISAGAFSESAGATTSLLSTERIMGISSGACQDRGQAAGALGFKIFDLSTICLLDTTYQSAGSFFIITGPSATNPAAPNESINLWPGTYSVSDYKDTCGSPSKDNTSSNQNLYDVVNGETIEFPVTEVDNMDPGVYQEIRVSVSTNYFATNPVSFYISVQIPCTPTTWQSVTNIEQTIEIGTEYLALFDPEITNTTPGCDVDSNAEITFTIPSTLTGFTNANQFDLDVNTIESTDITTTNGLPHIITVTQSATDRYGNVLTPVDTDLTLHIEIHDWNCDQADAEPVDLNFAVLNNDPIIVSLHETKTVQIPKIYRTTSSNTPSTYDYQSELCGYFSHTYSTEHIVHSTGVSETLTTSNGLPEFVTLDQDNLEYDTLTFDPTEVIHYLDYHNTDGADVVVTVTRTSEYSTDTPVQISQNAKVTTETFTFKIIYSDSFDNMEYSDPGVPPPIIYVDRPKQFTPDVSVSFRRASDNSYSEFNPGSSWPTCAGNGEEELDTGLSIQQCYEKCNEKSDCFYFQYGDSTTVTNGCWHALSTNCRPDVGLTLYKVEPQMTLLQSAQTCNGTRTRFTNLAFYDTPEQCYEDCRKAEDCQFFTFGTNGAPAGQCYQEQTIEACEGDNEVFLDNSYFAFYTAYASDPGFSNLDAYDKPWNDLFDPATVFYPELADLDTAESYSFMTMSTDGLFTLTFNPLELLHLGVWSITTVQTHLEYADQDQVAKFNDQLRDTMTPTKQTESSHEMRLYVETILTLEPRRIIELEFTITEDSRIAIPYYIDTQTPTAEQTFSFTFMIDGVAIVGNWITVDQDFQEIHVLPTETEKDLEGFHTIDVVCTAVYTDKTILPFLVDLRRAPPNDYDYYEPGMLGLSKSADTVVIYDQSFNITINYPYKHSAPVSGPIFVDELHDHLKVQGEEWSFTLPDAYDPNDREFTIETQFFPTIAGSFFDFLTPPVFPDYKLRIVPKSPTEVPGYFEIRFILTAIDEDETERKSYSNFWITIEEAPSKELSDQENDDGEVLLPSESENDQEFTFEEIFDEDFIGEEAAKLEPPPKIRKNEISSSGNLSIQFDQEIRLPQRMPDGTNMGISLVNDYGKFKGKFVPFENPELNEDGSLERRLQADKNQGTLLWTLKSMTETKMEFILTFDSPLEISEGFDPDILEVDLRRAQLLSKRTNKPLEIGPLDSNLVLPRQFPTLEEAKKVEAMADAVSGFCNSSLIVFVIAQTVAGKIIKKIIPLFLTLQLLFHLLVSLQFPVNTQTVFDALDDAIKVGAAKRLIFGYIEEKGYLDKVEGMKESIDQVGMIVYVGIPLISLLVVVSIVMTYLCKNKPGVQKFGKGLMDKMLFDTVINMLLVASLGLSVQAGFGRYFNYPGEFDGERPAQGQAQILIICGTLGFFYFFPKYVEQNERNCGDKDPFKKTYGMLYTKYRWWNPQAALYLFYFLLLRVAIVFVLNITAPFSIIYLFLMCVLVAWQCYLLLFDPFLHRQETAKEVMNSLLFSFFTYFIPAYTLMTPDAAIRYNFGYYSIAAVGMLVFFNLVWMIVNMVQDKCKQKVLKAILNQRMKDWQKENMEKKYIIESKPSSSEESVWSYYSEECSDQSEEQLPVIKEATMSSEDDDDYYGEEERKADKLIEFSKIDDSDYGQELGRVDKLIKFSQQGPSPDLIPEPVQMVKATTSFGGQCHIMAAPPKIDLSDIFGYGPPKPPRLNGLNSFQSSKMTSRQVPQQIGMNQMPTRQLQSRQKTEINSRAASRQVQNRISRTETQASNWSSSLEETKVSDPFGYSWQSRIVNNNTKTQDSVSVLKRKIVDITIPKPFDGREQAIKDHGENKLEPQMLKAIKNMELKIDFPQQILLKGKQQRH